VIEEGLNDGDEIALVDPSRSAEPATGAARAASSKAEKGQTP
jgi:hypothetical protein